MELKEIQKLKAYTSNEFNSDGDQLVLNIKFNENLRTLIKKAIVENLPIETENFFVGYDENDDSKYFSYERYKVKTIFYRELNNHDGIRDILFNKVLIDDGKIKIPFYDISKYNNFLNYFQSNLKTLIEILIGENVQREISFKLDTPTAE